MAAKRDGHMENELVDQANIPGRLRWRCRRGMRELDVLLTNFVDHHWSNLAPDEQQAFDGILETQDPVIMDWVMGRRMPPDPVVANLIERIVAHTRDRGEHR